MPSSLIFACLVVLWLLILVPAVARRQQEVARLSPAVLSGRVLDRPMRHRLPEVDMTERRDDGGATTVGELVDQRDDVPSPRDAGADEDELRDELDRELDPDEIGRELDEADHGSTDRTVDRTSTGRDAEWDDDLDRDDMDRDLDRDEPDDDRERPAVRYRPGRGGFDPDAAAATAHAKYAFRQRLVLALLVLLLGAGALALLVSDVFWWAAGGVGLLLAGYLTYLRRQVRIEESIRARRTARLAGTRRAQAAAEDPELDGWAPREFETDDEPASAVATGDTAVEDDEDEDWTADDGEPARVRGTGEPLGVLPARCRTVDGAESTEHTSSLPRVTAAPTPPIPSGTALVDVDDEDELDAALGTNEHRRAAGE